MKHIIMTSLMLFLVSVVSGCTINYKLEPEPKVNTPEQTALGATTPPMQMHTPGSLPPGVIPPGLMKEVNPSCLVVSLAPLDSVKQVKKEDYRSDKNIVGYIKELERQHELLLKVKEQYERCKLQD